MTEEQIIQNKERFRSLLNSLSNERRPSENALEVIMTWLSTNSGENGEGSGINFFEAPASAENYLSEPGGLCQHSLDVYDTLERLVRLYHKENEISEDSIIITALFHDVADNGIWEIYSRNVQDKTAPTGWKKEYSYRTMKVKNRDFIYGGHEQTSEHITRTFFPDLTDDEGIAILYHHAGSREDSSQMNVGEIWGRSLLSLLLHMADVMAVWAPLPKEESVDKYVIKGMILNEDQQTFTSKQPTDSLNEVENDEGLSLPPLEGIIDDNNWPF